MVNSDLNDPYVKKNPFNEYTSGHTKTIANINNPPSYEHKRINTFPFEPKLTVK